MNQNAKNWISVIGSGIAIGATIGIVARFATDGKTLKYAAVGAVIGVVTVVGINLIGMAVVEATQVVPAGK